MKIIFSSYDDIKNPYYGGGGAASIHEIAKRLSQNNDVLIYTGAYINSKDEIVDNVNYKRIGFNSMGPKLGQIIFQLSLPFYVLISSFDVWIESFTPPFSTAFLPIFTSKPVVGITQLLGGINMTKKYHIPFHKIEEFGLKHYKNIIVLTKQIEDKVKRINPKINSIVIPNGVSDEFFKGNYTKKSDKYILYIGRLDIEQKGIDLLIDSYSLISKKVTVPLVIAGNGSKAEIAYLMNRIKELKLESKIKYVGRVNGKAKIKLFNDSLLFAMSSRYESFGITILEALATNTPVVLFDITDLKWVPNKHSIKASPYNTEEYAKAMLKIYDNSSFRKSLRNDMREYVENYNWDSITKKYMNYFATI